MKRKLLTLCAVLCTATLMTTPVLANNCADSVMPTKYIGYTTYANTEYRTKTDATSHYIKNSCGFELWVNSRTTDNTECAINGHAIVPSSGEYFVRNLVSEKGYHSCRLMLSTSKSGIQGPLRGVWSPDSVGNYPCVN